MRAHPFHFCLVLAVGCAASGGDPVDSGRTRMDADSTDSGARDSGVTDAGRRTDSGSRPDSGGVDAGNVDAGGVDGGAGAIVIDGLVTDAEWLGASEAANTTVSAWGVNAMERLRVLATADDLYVALEASLEAGAENTLVVYVDTDLGGGVGIGDLFSLTDSGGALDNGLSAGITTPATFAADYAWGTRDMGRSQVGLDPRMGWRDIASDVDDFAWVDAADAPTVCGAAACETRIALSTLGAPAGSTIALFARLTNTDGTDFSNTETLPQDDPANPDVVMVLLELSR